MKKKKTKNYQKISNFIQLVDEFKEL